MVELSRRNFLKALGLASTTAAIGCSSESARRLIPYVIPPEDIVPGEATWYATTCRECPAGCGLLAKNRDGRVIKVEGNPLHPINQGKLCARGQSSVQGLYNPDRLTGPRMKNGQGKLEPISWERAGGLLSEKIAEVIKKGRGDRIVFLTDLMSGTLKDLIVLWLSVMGSKGLIQYEPLSYEPLRKGNQIVFGVDGIPAYHIDRADFLISFGADFLETWVSNVEYARQFSSFRSQDQSKNSPFVYVGPRLSMTGANADRWVSVPPGSEFLVALGMIRVILEEDLAPSLRSQQKALLKEMVVLWPLERIARETGIKEPLIRNLARRFAGSQNPLALSGSMGTETSVAANLLCTIIPGNQDLIDLERLSSLGETVTAAALRELFERMAAGEVDLLLVCNANPVFSLPASWDVLKGIQKVPFLASFSSAPDETTEHAHLCLPTHTPLEAWGDYSPRKGIWDLMQPVMGTLFDTRHLGDILLESGRKVGDPRMFPWQDFYQMLRYMWDLKRRRRSPDMTSEDFWEETMKRGGSWDTAQTMIPKRTISMPRFSFPTPGEFQESETAFRFMAYPTGHLFDGRMANRPWLQELPDPLTQVTWGTWIEIHPETAKGQGIAEGDILRLETLHGSLEAPAFIYEGVHPSALAMPMGQGHTACGRFADLQPGNPMVLFAPKGHGKSGAVHGWLSGVELAKTGRAERLANTDGSPYQHGRGIAQSLSLESYLEARREKQEPALRLPLPEGYTLHEDIYPFHPHPTYRWAMVVDLDRCIGCAACVVACYAENNVPVVGKDQVLKGREMSWLRIQRFFESHEPIIRFIPVLCQHCDNAPCESVCPVFAPHHSIDGLNNQVYNRCIGTRYCSQNCPYKVRRFNWFTFTRPDPLHWQLNPDVTVRQKGVMEKCSFCIQRIVEGKRKATNEGRKVRDGEIIPACVQTCPADALTFGNLVDERSRVSQLIEDPRAYQVFAFLNTKPAVFYLKRVIREEKGL